ncbi:MAG: CBS domain-containing protein [Chitinivibrionales bacterium]|nr:CBS domain-containing protein [Chitinivibrionales bacterium]
MNVRDILKQKGSLVNTISPEKTVHEAANALVEKNIGSLVVKDAGDTVVGIITERDILRQCSTNVDSLKKTKIKDVMTKKLLIATPDDQVESVKTIMTEHRIRHLPIMDGKKLVGLISIGDVLKASAEICEVERKYLSDYITGPV